MTSYPTLLQKLWRYGYGAKGSLYPQGASGIEVELPVGAAGKVLTADSIAAGGMKWSDVSGGGGAGGVLPGWVAYNPDTPPASSHLEDDEFNVSSLNAKWTETASGSPTHDIDTSIRGHYVMRVTANSQSILLNQAFAPGGDAGLTIRARGGFSVSNDEVRAYFSDSNGTTLANAMAVSVRNSGTGWAARLLSRDASVTTERAALTIGSGLTSFVLHLQRTTNSWAAWFSVDGWAFTRVGAFSKTFTVAGIVLSLQGPTSGFLVEQMAIDWVRRDWITL